MLSVVVYVGRREIARAEASNMSDLAKVSDYKIVMREHAAPQLDIEERKTSGWIREHPRNQSVWRLVEKIARLWDADDG